MLYTQGTPYAAVCKQRTSSYKHVATAEVAALLGQSVGPAAIWIQRESAAEKRWHSVLACSASCSCLWCVLCSIYQFNIMCQDPTAVVQGIMSEIWQMLGTGKARIYGNM